MTRPLILFDGVCNLCNGAVAWVVEHDAGARYTFASLHSQVARDALAARAATAPLPDSIVLIDDGAMYVRSDAVLKIAAGLAFPWSLAVGLHLVPRPLRDWMYAWVARNRYRWFGTRESCMVPTPELRARFLDADEAVVTRDAADAAPG